MTPHSIQFVQSDLIIIVTTLKFTRFPTLSYFWIWIKWAKHENDKQTNNSKCPTKKKKRRDLDEEEKRKKEEGKRKREGCHRESEHLKHLSIVGIFLPQQR